MENFNKTKVEELLQKLDQLTGLEAVKAEIRKVIGDIMMDRRAEEMGVGVGMMSRSLHMAFVGAPGTGKTTVARIVGEIYQALGILSGNEQGVVEVNARELLSPYVGQTAVETQKVIDRAKGGVLIIDDVGCLMERAFGPEALNSIACAMEEHRDSIAFILVDDEKGMNKLLDFNQGLISRIGTKIVFEASTTPDVGNARGVCKPAAMAENAKSVRPNGFLQQGKTPAEELLAELNAMEGMESLKEVVNDIATRVSSHEMKKAMGLESQLNVRTLHMVFSGEPGMGKTIMARKIGEIYMALGILPGNQEGLVEVSAQDLVGGYVGQTAEKTHKVIDRAMGGILFIDEADCLCNSSFGLEALDALVRVMEDKRDSFMVILAGATKEMEEFLDKNPGLRSRIREVVEF